MLNRETISHKVSAALRDVLEDEALEIQARHHLVDDLGFDSMDIASLTIALEDEFDEMLLLNDWIAAASDPSQLTVDSLVDYLADLLSPAG